MKAIIALCMLLVACAFADQRDKRHIGNPWMRDDLDMMGEGIWGHGLDGIHGVHPMDPRARMMRPVVDVGTTVWGNPGMIHPDPYHHGYPDIDMM